jgi:hypothetical protein
MIVIGADPHKRTHTAAAVDSASGELRSSATVAAKGSGQARLLDWARARAGARRGDRALPARLRWAGALPGRARRARAARAAEADRGRAQGRARGECDPSAALALARAAPSEGLETLPAALLDERALALKPLLDQRAELVAESTRAPNRLRRQLHEIDPELAPRERSLRHRHLLRPLGARLARRQQTVRVRLARQLVRRRAAHEREPEALERERDARVREQAPEPLELPRCGTLTAAKPIAESAGAGRFRTDAKPARHARSAPPPAAAAARQRHRLDRRGNRQPNRAFHPIALTQARIHPEARASPERKRPERQPNREAPRNPKRHLLRRLHRPLASPQLGSPQPMPSTPPRANPAAAAMPRST